MRPSLEAFNLIKSFESLRLKAYKAVKTEKYYTIGYGHYGREVWPNWEITNDEADVLLIQDVDCFAARLDAYCPNLTQNQYDALVSFIFNVGWTTFKQNSVGKLAHNLNVSSRPIHVARRMVLYVRSGGKVLLGLQRRRVIEANHFLGREIFYLKDGMIYEYL